MTIIGQGYVGLPLAQEATRSGYKVWGFDVNESTVSNLNNGLSHIDDLENEDVQNMIDGGYRATSDPECIKQSEIIVICVPTPLGEGGTPELSFIEKATSTAGKYLAKGTTVVLESTTYPGTTEEICLPLLEKESGLQAGKDFSLAFSPERVDPGSNKFGISNTPKLVGGIDEKSTEEAKKFYASFVDEVVSMSGTKEAETAKLLENTFRHVNIALVNEMAKLCHELEIDIWEVIRGAATKPFGFMRFNPGAGVGGHCIPIDPNYLSYEVRKELGYPFRFVELAQEVNNSMPNYVVDRIGEILNEKRKPLNGSTVLLLGVTYKPNIADQRQSPAQPIAEQLLKKQAEVQYHDPFVEKWELANGDVIERVSQLHEALENADIVVLLQAHSEYDVQRIKDTSIVFFDTCGAVESSEYRL